MSELPRRRPRWPAATLLLLLCGPATPAPAAPSPYLVLVVRVERVSINRLPGTRRHHVVESEVLRVVKGKFASRRFDFRIHSPARAGVRKGAVLQIGAGLTKASGYLVLESGIRNLPREPRSKDLSCKRDRDCRFAYEACPLCPPCQPTWRQVSNRRAYARDRARMRGQKPMCGRCKPCPDGESSRLGNRPVCVRGQCTVIELPRP